LSKIVEEVPDESLSTPPAALESEDPDAILTRGLNVLQLQDRERLVPRPLTQPAVFSPNVSASGIEPITPYYKATALIKYIKNIEELDEWISKLIKKNQDFSETVQTCNNPMWSVLYLVKKPTGNILLCRVDFGFDLVRNSIIDNRFRYSRDGNQYILLIKGHTVGYEENILERYYNQSTPQKSIYVSLETAQEIIRTYDRKLEDSPEALILLELEYAQTIGALATRRSYGDIQYRNIDVYNLIV